MMPRSFPYSNAFIAKWRSQTLSFKKRDGQKNKQKNKQTKKNIELFRPLAAHEIRAPPNLAW